MNIPTSEEVICKYEIIWFKSSLSSPSCTRSLFPDFLIKCLYFASAITPSRLKSGISHIVSPPWTDKSFLYQSCFLDAWIPPSQVSDSDILPTTKHHQREYHKFFPKIVHNSVSHVWESVNKASVKAYTRNSMDEFWASCLPTRERNPPPQ